MIMRGNWSSMIKKWLRCLMVINGELRMVAPCIVMIHISGHHPEIRTCTARLYLDLVHQAVSYPV